MQPWRQQHTSATAPAGLACLAAVGLVLAIVQQAVAEPDVDSHWVQIAHCHHLDGRSGPPQRLDKSLDEIFQLANQATRVRICTDKGHETGPSSNKDCVTSKPNAYPIKNLRARDVFVSHYHGTGKQNLPCDAKCVSAGWTGSETRLKALTSTCGSTNQEKGYEMLYHACGNPSGLHFGLAVGKPNVQFVDLMCGWVSGGGGGLIAYIDAGQTTTATTITATTTTHTYDSAFGTTSTRIEALKRAQEQQAASTASAATRLVAVEADGLEFTAKIENNKESVSVLTSKLEAQAGEIADLKATVAKLVSALAAAAAAGVRAPSAGASEASCQAPLGGESPCSAAVESAGKAQRVVLSSPSTVQINTGKCGVVDLCAVDASVRDLQAALNVE